MAVWNSLLCGNFIINETKQQKDSGSLYYFFVCNLLDEVLTVINHCLSLATSVVITVLGFNKSLCYLNSLLIYLVIHLFIFLFIYLQGISLCSLNRLRTHCVAQAGLRLLCTRITSMCYYAQHIFISKGKYLLVYKSFALLWLQSEIDLNGYFLIYY